MRLKIIVVRYFRGVFNLPVCQQVVVEKIVFCINSRVIRTLYHKPDKQPSEDKYHGSQKYAPLQDF